MLNEMNSEEKTLMKKTIENTFANSKIAKKLNHSTTQTKKTNKSVSFQENPKIVEIRN